MFLEQRQGLFDLEHHLWYLDELHVGDTVTVHWRCHGVMCIVNGTHGRLSSVFEYLSAGVRCPVGLTSLELLAYAPHRD